MWFELMFFFRLFYGFERCDSTAFSNFRERRFRKSAFGLIQKCWCARMESNHPPPLYQSGVLPLNYVRIKNTKVYHWAYPYSLIKFNLLKPSLSNLMFCWGISKSMVKDLFKFFIRNTKLFVINHMVKRRKNTVRE